MPVVKITGQGLWAMALAVALLWGCVAGERLLSRRAATERARVLREIKVFQRTWRPQPVSAPLPGIPHRAPVTVG